MNQPTNHNQFGNYPFPPQYGNMNPTQSPTGYQQPGPYQPTQPTQSPLQVPFMPPSMPTGNPQVPGMLPVEESYIENILRLNKGKLVTIYTTFENNREWNAKIFKGIIEAAGRDHIIISDPQTGLRYLIPMVYLDYITFDEEIEYEYPFASSQPNLASYPPR
ncbi:MULTISPECIES: spore coat protein GerQ [Bacillaceae]|uniref:Spore germination protein Q n=1 Tax=Peribacillus huizhouensis TaxID=1501239 RepID=A0ABR6CUB8_9BACI|nr:MULTISPECIES: spore coat protein GerQ [Bacillaceae]MBA9027927.1 spore germination protein Q [Peribacillus huizhouensis]